MRYIKMFENFVIFPEREIKDYILSVSESPELVRSWGDMQVWECDVMGEESFVELKERLSYLDLDVFDCGKFYENGQDVGHRLVICEKEKVNLIPIDKYGDKIARVFREHPFSWLFYSLYDVEWKFDYVKKAVRDILVISFDYSPVSDLSPFRQSLRSRAFYDSAYSTPWSFDDQIYITQHDCQIFETISRFGVNEVQDLLSHRCFFEYMNKEGKSPDVGSALRNYLV